MEPLSDCLEIEKGKGARAFSANVTGITFLKAQFLLEAKEFFYLRKGEDVNAHIIATIYGHSLGFDWGKITDIETRKDVDELLNFVQNETWFSKLDARRDKHIIDYRIICIEEEHTIRGKNINDHLGVSVKFIPSEKRHLYRLYLNDDSFAFFYRNGVGQYAKFYGYICEDDPEMINSWKNAFIEEWKTWEKLEKNKTKIIPQKPKRKL